MYSKWKKRSCLTGWILSYFVCLRVVLSSHAASWCCQQKLDESERKSELIRITFSPIRSIVYWMCLWLVALLIAVTSHEHTWVMVISPGWLELEYICRSLMTFRIFLKFSLNSGKKNSGAVILNCVCFNYITWQRRETYESAFPVSLHAM